jgi:hypothetical protein
MESRDSSNVIDRRFRASDRPRMAIALDTLAYARRLREAGFSDAQAEGQAEALAATMTDTLATKQDLGEVRHEVHELQIRMEAGFAAAKESLREMELRMDTRFREQTAQVRSELAELERRMTMRFGTVTVAAIGAVSAIVKLMA